MSSHQSKQPTDTKFFEVLETSANNISTLPLTTVKQIYQNTTTNLAENIPLKLQELDVEYLNNDGSSQDPTAHWKRNNKSVCAASFTRGLIPHIKSKRKRKVIRKLQECLAVDKNSPINPMNYRSADNNKKSNKKKWLRKKPVSLPLATGISVDIADINFSNENDLAAPTIPTYQKNHTSPETNGKAEDTKQAQQKYNEAQLLQFCGSQSNPPPASSIDLNEQVAGSIKGPYNFIGNNNLMNKGGEPITNSTTIKSDFHQTKAAKQTARAKEREEVQKAEEQVDSIREYAALLDQYSLHHFLVFNGRTVFESPEFESFKTSHASIWGPIVTTISALEKLLKKYEVPVAIINGPKLATIATLESFRLEELLSCVANADQIESLIKLNKIKSQKRGKKRNAAAILIQSIVRMFLVRNVLWYEKQRGVVSKKFQAIGRGFIARNRVKSKLRQSRKLKNKKWFRIQQSLFDNFGHISQNRDKFLIFLPSLSIEEHLRLILEKVAQIENMNLNACFEGALDSSTHVVYISPQPLPEEVLLHLRTLLERYGLGASKLHVLVPENSQIFSSHMPLTQLLHYSPLCLRRLKYLVRTRPAYIVPSMVTWREKEIAIALEIPILCGMDIAKQSELTLRSGGKRACMEAGVNVPIGAHDIYNEEQLALALTKLIVGNLDVDRWLIKLDCDYQDLSTAYLDVEKALPESVPLLRTEKVKLEEMNEGVKDPWLHPDVQMIARSKVMTELQAALPQGALILGGSALSTPSDSVGTKKKRISSPKSKKGNIFYADYPSYLAFICRYGCVVEAEPKHIQGYPVVHLLIEPEQLASKITDSSRQNSIPLTDSGESEGGKTSDNNKKDSIKETRNTPKIEVKATHDAIIEHARYGHLGALYPATSAPQSALIGAAKRIGQSLYRQKGLIGYVTLRFVVFADYARKTEDSLTNPSLTNKKRLRMWATGIEVGLSQLAASHGMYTLLSQPNTAAINQSSALTEEDSQQIENNSIFSGITGAGDMEVDEKKEIEIKKDFHYLLLPRVGHPSLQHLSFASFFKSCRLEGISFSMEYRAGPSFLLYDSLLGGTIGIMAMANSPERALHFGLGALGFLRRTLGTRDLPTTKEGRNLLRTFKVLSQLYESMQQHKIKATSNEMDSKLTNH